MPTANPDDYTQPTESVPAFGDPDLDDPNVVAVFRLPIDLSDLVPLSNLLEKIYGRDLVTGSRGSTGARFFVVRRPEPGTTTAEREAPYA